jgi:type I restriction enzyme S subunit
MKKYGNYKNSGIEWIGSYPKDWTLMTVRRVTDDHKQGYYSSEEYKEEGYKLVRITDLDINGNINISKSPSVSPNDKEIQIFEIRKGDMLFPRTGSIGLIGVAKEDMKAVFASYLIRFRFKAKTHNSFMRYYFMSDVFLNGLFSDLHGGVNQNIHAENIKDQHIVLPSKDEQSAIANYLDHKTVQIDNLISKKQQFITLLQEERIAVINQAVTKGLDPKVKMKNSGIEWLGEIPEHWEVKKLKYHLKTTKGFAFKSDLFTDKGIPVVKASDIKNKTIRLKTAHYIPEIIAKDYESVRLSKGDILISTVGSTPDVVKSAVGQIGMVPYELEGALLNQNTVRLEILDNKALLNNFLFFLIQNDNYRSYLDLNAHGTANQASLKLLDILGFETSFPSIEEQQKIINHIELELSRINTLISKTQQEIELVKEYKTALISEVVTGKVDVRDVVLN